MMLAFVTGAQLMPCDPDEQGREDGGAEDDPERGLRQIAARRLLGKLARDELEIAFDQREVGARLVGRRLSPVGVWGRHRYRRYSADRTHRLFCCSDAGDCDFPGST
jgi:hypothetical protein